MVVTLQQAWDQATRTLHKAGIAEPRREAQYLLCAHVTPEQPADASYLFTHADFPLPEPELFAQRLDGRCQHRPLSRLIGRRAFWRDSWVISDDVLDPRPDSEALIEVALSLYPDRTQPLRILDLGCGSGCLALSLLREFPRATAIGSDISHAALAIARINAERLGLSARVHWTHSDWWDNISACFDLIVCNPPYLAPDIPLPTAVSEYDPPLALYAEHHGLAAYGRIIPKLEHHLRRDGVAIIESSPWQTEDISILAHQNALCCFSPLDHSHQPWCSPQQLGICVITTYGDKSHQQQRACNQHSQPL